MVESPPPSFLRARLLFWTLVCLFVLVWAIGKSWDERYHVTHLFDTFWSPPHLFLYSGYLLVALVFLAILFRMRDIHAHFGPPLRVPLLAFPVPASLLLVGLGLALTGVAGLLNSKYHEALGLGETHWSVPHLMLGMSGLLMVMGFAAAAVALRKWGPLSRGALPFVFWGLFMFATGAALGPAFNVAVPQMYQAVLDNRIPGVQVVLGDDLRGTLQAYIVHGLTRAHPVVLPAVAFMAAALLATFRALAPGRWSGTAWATLYTALAVWDAGVGAAAWRLYDSPGPTPAYVLPFPLLAMVLVVGLLERRAGGWSYAVAGGAAGAVWGAGGAGILLGATSALAGREVGGWLYKVLAVPTRRNITATALLLGVVTPLVLGGLDITLRQGRYWWLL